MHPVSAMGKEKRERERDSLAHQRARGKQKRTFENGVQKKRRENTKKKNTYLVLCRTQYQKYGPYRNIKKNIYMKLIIPVSDPWLEPPFRPLGSHLQTLCFPTARR